ncbi:putative MFS monocarboxylate transporter [Xylaria nigripes]|nr:putative MFS monocarboxylate transporter [Xylaria nigripes]
MMAPLIEPPPGFNSFRSWLAVGGASLSLFCTVGFINAFGVYQEYYASGFLRNYSESDISWIGSVSIFLLYIGSPITGLLVDKLGSRILLLTGSTLQLAAVFLSSICSQYYQLFLSQAVLLGIGMSLIFTPSLAIVSRRMPHRRGLAIGITIGGSSIGGLIWPIMLQQLLYNDSVSFGWAQRAVGFTMLPLLATACLTVVDVERKPASTVPPGEERGPNGGAAGEKNGEPTIEEKPKTTQRIIAMFKNLAFAFLCVGLAFVYLGLFTPFFYISTYAVSKGISSSAAFYLISAINAASFFGRVVPGHLADKYGHFNICTLAALISGIIALTWTAADSLPGMVVWSIAYGFTSGAILSLQGACAGKIAKPEQQGMALGLVTGSVAIPSLIGTPISGQILSQGGYLGLAVWTGVTLLVGSIILVGARLKLNSKILAAN